MSSDALQPLVMVHDENRSSSFRNLLLCDRDGVLIEDRPDYIRDADEVTVLRGVPAALRRANEVGYGVVVVSNQSGVGRGLVSLQQALSVHTSIVEMLIAKGAHISASFLCPHVAAHNCCCRKPAAGMIEAALSLTGVSPKDAVLVGDAASDVRAAIRAGVTPVLVRTGRGGAHESIVSADLELSQTRVFDDLGEAVTHLLLDLVARDESFIVRDRVPRGAI